MLSGFKKFILRGNVVDMAVGVVIGAGLRKRRGWTHRGFHYASDRAICRASRDYSSLNFHIRTTEFPIGDFVQYRHFVPF